MSVNSIGISNILKKWESELKQETLYFYDEEEKIKELLMFRKIVKVDEDTLYLDNGVELQVLPNEGCGGCGNGWYHIEELNNCDNAITNVEFECEDINPDGYWDSEHSYKIFVYAENTRIKIVQVDGDDGNGYYGTGYSIKVKIPDSKAV